jgi:hypothetical protein
MVYNFFTSVLFLFYSFTGSDLPTNNTAISTPVEKTAVTETESLYNTISAHNASMPTMDCFERAVKGYNLLKAQGKIQRDLLTVIDFSKSSNTKRLWIIDMKLQTVIYNTLVAHGRNSGDEFAKSFSNTNSSNMSSLGFYATGELYNGKHGQSLKLDGLENGLNSNARSRGVVMHAADYVSDAFIKLHHRLGRSQGCPALPSGITKEVINLIKGKSCLFIYHPEYNRESKILS